MWMSIDKQMPEDGEIVLITSMYEAKCKFVKESNKFDILEQNVVLANPSYWRHAPAQAKEVVEAIPEPENA